VRCEHEIDVGAYVLDALEPGEQLRMQQHVQTCPVCSAAVQELEGLPRLLAAVPAPGDPPEAPVPSELAFQRFRRSAVESPPGRRRHRWRWTVATAAAALVIGGVVTSGVVTSSTVAAPEVVQAVHDGVHLTATYEPASRGTDVTIALDGVPMGEQCELVAVGRDGTEETAGTWEVGYPGTYTWTGWVAMDPHDVASWDVRTTDGRTLVTVAA
jgi:anti-sigma-K factor RskA